MLHKPNPIQPCIAMDIQLLIESAYRAVQANDLPGKGTWLNNDAADSGREALGALADSLAYIPSYSGEGALATACALYGALGINTEKLPHEAQADVQRAKLMTLQLINFLERKFGLDRVEMGLDYFCSDWAEAAHLPWAVEQAGAA